MSSPAAVASVSNTYIDTRVIEKKKKEKKIERKVPILSSIDRSVTVVPTFNEVYSRPRFRAAAAAFGIRQRGDRRARTYLYVSRGAASRLCRNPESLAALLPRVAQGRFNGGIRASRFSRKEHGRSYAAATRLARRKQKHFSHRSRTSFSRARGERQFCRGPRTSGKRLLDGSPRSAGCVLRERADRMPSPRTDV